MEDREGVGDGRSSDCHQRLCDEEGREMKERREDRRKGTAVEVFLIERGRTESGGDLLNSRKEVGVDVERVG